MRNTGELLERVQYFKFDNKLHDLGVYSRQYLSNILFWKYSADNKYLLKNEFAVIFGDFNKLSAINRKYSDKAGDEAVYTAMSIMKKTLPPHTKIARVAGDEIIMIIEDISKDDANQFISAINSDLSSPLNNPYNLTISLAASHSSEKNGIEEMYEEAESLVNSEKLISKQNSLSNDKIEILKEKISKDFENYFSLFRFSEDYTLSVKELKSIMKRTLNSIISVIEHDEISTIEQTPLELKGSPINRLKAKLIDDELSKESVNPASFTSTILLEVLDSLLREPISTQYSRRYLEDYKSTVQDNTEIETKKYNALQFSTSFLKLSNSISGHIKTDKDIRTLSNNLMQSLSTFIPFDKSALESGFKNIFLDVGGADFLAIYDKDIDITSQELNLILQEINTNSPTLKITSYVSKEPISIQDVSSFLQEAASNSKNKKDRIKENKIPTEQSQKALDLLLSDCLGYYKENFKTENSISHDTFNGKVKFMNLMFEELLQSALRVFYPEKLNDTISSSNNITIFPKELFNLDDKNSKPNKDYDEMMH